MIVRLLYIYNDDGRWNTISLILNIYFTIQKKFYSKYSYWYIIHKVTKAQVVTQAVGTDFVLVYYLVNRKFIVIFPLHLN